MISMNPTMTTTTTMTTASQIQASGVDTADVSGDMTFDHVHALLRQAESLLVAGSKIRQINLAKVQKVDSSGLALLLEWQATARRNNTTLSITQAPADLLSLARLCEAQDLLQLTARG